jgi:hypothetical protein
MTIEEKKQLLNDFQSKYSTIVTKMAIVLLQILIEMDEFIERINDGSKRE